MHLKLTTLPILLAAALFGAPSLKAYVYRVDMNTSALIGADNAPFFLDFQLNEGSNTTVIGTVTLSNFVLTGGTPSGSAILYSGAASGDLTTGFSLTSSSANPFSEIYQGFSAGTTDITFLVTMPELFTGLTPMQFNVAILDSESGNPQIITDAPDTVSLVSTPVQSSYTLSAVSTYSSTTPAGVTASAAAVPEPSTWATMAAGAIYALGMVRRRRRA